MIAHLIDLGVFVLVVNILSVNCAVVQPQVALSTFPSQSGFSIQGAAPGDQAGFAVSSAGDINGDGIGDIIVGAYAASPTPVGGSARGTGGAAYIIFGRRSTNNGNSFGSIKLSKMNTTVASPGFRVIGAQGSSWCGFSIKKAGDVNKDGIDDLIIGAPFANTANSQAGISYIILGRNVTKTGIPFTNIDLAAFSSAATAGYRILGVGTTDHSGYSVSAAGDMNGDGFGDVVVGAPVADPIVGGVSRTDAGIVYIVFGRAAIADVDLTTFATTTTAGFRVLGAAANDAVGNSVSGAGDVNGDGCADIIIGAFGNDAVINGVTRTGGGVAYVLFGRTAVAVATTPFVDIDLTTFAAAPTKGFRILGAAASAFSGYIVASAGDVNGDRHPDIIVVSRSGVDNVRTVNVIFGRNAALAGAYADIDLATFSTPTSVGFRIIGALSNDDYSSASGGGDVNGDGIDDIVVGANVASYTVGGVTRSQAGLAYVVFGRDVSAGAPTFTDISLASFGTPSVLGFRILGVLDNDNLGGSVSVAGDVNGDGFGDVIVGARFADTSSGADSGAAYVVYGAPVQPTSQPSSHPSAQPSRQPSRQPSQQPSSQPTGQPSSRPSSQPSRQPSSQPSLQPSAQPSVQPSRQPSSRPTCQPSGQPTGQPSLQPSAQPSRQPSFRPSRQPSSQPSSQPSEKPTTQPSGRPTTQPTVQPSTKPSQRPTAQPSHQPSTQPTSRPSMQPSGQPSKQPSGIPTEQPTARPSCQPTCRPSAQPSGRPSTQPSERPSVQPTSVPSSQPTLRPSVEPTSPPTALPSSQPTNSPTGQPSCSPSTASSAQPSGQPTTQPTAQPSGLPSSVPSAQPIALPTLQPTSVPTVQPTTMPSSQPSEQPAGHPSSQPSAQPSIVPSGQPSQQPRAAPSGQPTAAPSARPTLAPTGEWVTVLSQNAVLVNVFYPGGDVWACGATANASTTVCVLTDIYTGSIVTQYTFDWVNIRSVIVTSVANKIIINGQRTNDATTASDVATCMIAQGALLCSVVSFHDANFLAMSYVPYPNKLVSIGWYNAYASISILDVASNTVQSNLYTASNMKALTLSQIQSPPNFLGCIVAGTAIRATATPVNYVVAGMFRTDGAILRGMVLMPASGDILNSADLVNTMALETTGPDSFIAGGLQLADNLGMNAYLIRANALFNTIQFCARYSAASTRRRRALAATTATSQQSVVRSMVLVDTTLFMIVDRTNNNVTALTVLKIATLDGSIIQQVHVTAPNATSLYCTQIVAVESLLSVVCSFRNHSTTLTQSLVLAVDQTLSFAVLPVGFVRSEEAIFSKESILFTRAALTITKSDSNIASSTYEFNTADRAPTRRPLFAPSLAPSSQPSSAPSGQPSSSPTAVPSVSARPTSQPSSAVPTITHRPSAKPIVAPTRMPSVVPTTRPSFRPTANPTRQPTTVAPTALPTVRPSALPTVAPRERPSARPTATPSVRPTPAGSSAATSAPYVVIALPGQSSNNSSRLPPYVVGASIGAGLALLLLGYAGYQYYSHQQEMKDKEVRRLRYFLEQAELAAKTEADLAKFIQQAEDRRSAARLEKQMNQLDKENRAARRRRGRGRGAHAFGANVDSPVHRGLGAEARSTSNSLSSDSVAVSTLHSSERSSKEESHVSSDYNVSEGENTSENESEPASEIESENESNNSGRSAYSFESTHSHSGSQEGSQFESAEFSSELNSSQYSDFVNDALASTDSNRSGGSELSGVDLV